jgi:hypothetical protein
VKKQCARRIRGYGSLVKSMIAFDVLSECIVTAESLSLDPGVAWHLP